MPRVDDLPSHTGPPAWRVRAAGGGGGLVALGLSVLFVAGAGTAIAGQVVSTLALVVIGAGLVLTAASTARATWQHGLRWAQARVTVPVAVVGLVVLALVDGEPVATDDLLGFVFAPLLALILAGVQLMAWAPGSDARMRRAVAEARTELDDARAEVEATLRAADAPRTPGTR